MRSRFPVSNDQASPSQVGEDRISIAEARRQPLEASTTWEYPSPATLRFLARQKRRVEDTLRLKALIVQDERGLVALWTGERVEAQIEPESRLERRA